MSSRPLVSVIVTAYRHERTVVQALESIAAQQTDFEYEVVIGEDASDDGTRALCEEFIAAHPRFRLMPEMPNKGIVRNYFDCLRACRGKYVTDCSADDFWPLTTRLQQQVDFMERHHDVVAVHGRWSVLDEKTCHAYTPKFPQQDTVTDGRRKLTDVLSCQRRRTICLSSALYRREVLMTALSARPELLENEEFGMEDVPVSAALCAAGNIGWLPIEALCYRIHADSASNSDAPLRNYALACGSLKCVKTLAEAYGIDATSLSDAPWRYALGTARATGLAELCREALRLTAESPRPHTVGLRVSRMLTALRLFDLRCL